MIRVLHRISQIPHLLHSSNKIPPKLINTAIPYRMHHTHIKDLSNEVSWEVEVMAMELGFRG